MQNVSWLMDPYTIQSPVEATLPPVVVNFMDIFKGLGKLSVRQDFKLQSGANQVDFVVYAASRTPFRLGDRVFKKLDEMVEKKNVHSCTRANWVSHMMVVGKPDGVV